MISFLNLNIFSAITFSIVLIHFAFTPTFEPIRRPQKNLAKALLMIDFLLMCRVQLSPLVLSLMHKTTLLLTFLVTQQGKHSLNYFLWEQEMPPELQGDWLATTCYQRAVMNNWCRWYFWNQVRNWSLKLDPRIGWQGVRDEVKLVLHCWVDKVEMVVLVHHCCCLLQCKVYVGLKVRLHPKEILCWYLINIPCRGKTHCTLKCNA